MVETIQISCQTTVSFLDSLAELLKSFMTVILLGAMSFAAYGHEGSISIF